MIRHFFIICFSLFLFLPRILLPRAQGDQDIEGVADKHLVDETWMSSFVNEVQVGYTHSRTYSIQYQGVKATLIESEYLMRAKIRGHNYETTSSKILIVGEGYEPVYFKVIKGSGRHEMSTEGRREDDTMVAEKHSPWTSSQVNIPLEPDIHFAGHSLQVLGIEEISPGVNYTFKILDIEDLQVEDLTMTLLERRKIEPDSTLGLSEAEGELFLEKWSVGNNIVQYWRDAEGKTWRREEGNQYSFRTTEEKAVDFSPELDIWENIAFMSDKVILNSKKTDEMKIQFKVKDVTCNAIFGEDERLKVLDTSEKEDTCTVVLMSSVPLFDEKRTVDIPIQQSEYETYLEATPYIQSDDTTIVRLARDIIGNERDAYRAAGKLCEWVHFNIHYRFLFTNVTALDVLEAKSGDCSEFSLLYTALARAAGIPTRECQGIVYGSEGKFYRHAWIESWVGDWVAMDPTWNEPIADATHLKFGEVYATTPKSITPVDIRVLDYQFETEREKVRMSDIDLNLSFVHNDTVSKKYSPLKKRLGLFRRGRRTGRKWLADVDTLRQEITDFISKYPKSIAAVRARHDLAEIHFFAEDYDKAVSELEAFIDTYYYLDEELTSASLRRIGESYLRQQRYDDALSVFRQVKEQYPQSKAVDAMVLDVEEIAHYLRNQGQYGEAIDQYKEMMDLFPARKTIYQEKLADIYYSQGDYDKALDQYDHLITLYPDRETIYNEQIALLFRRLGRVDEAVSKFKEMMELFPEREMIYWEQIAETYKKADRNAETVSTYKDLIELFPEREVVYCQQIAKVYKSMGEHERAITEYKNLAERHPEKTAVCYEQIAKIYLGQKLYERAITQYEQLMELLPERKMIYEERIATVYEKEGAYDKAVAQYQTLIRNYPEREKIYAEKIEKLSKQ